MGQWSYCKHVVPWMVQHGHLYSTIIFVGNTGHSSHTLVTVIFSDLNSGMYIYSICDLSTVLNSCETGKYCQLQWDKFTISSQHVHLLTMISISLFLYLLYQYFLGNGCPCSFSARLPVLFNLETSESNYCSKHYYDFKNQ